MKSLKIIPVTFIIMTLTAALSCQGTPDSSRKGSMNSTSNAVFVTYIEWPEQLGGALWLAESIRTFGGKFKDAPIWIYHPDDLALEDRALLDQLQFYNAELRANITPEKARWFFYGGKPYAAAAAEAAAAADKTALVIFMDPDTIVLMEPVDLAIAPDKSFAYCPVMHNRAGSLLENPPDPFWSRIYELTSVTDEMLFPMTTPADRQEIRAYFHCGLLSLRPEKGTFKKWADDFTLLINDSALVKMCREDSDKRVFLHQNALTGAVFHTTARSEMLELDNRYNYPIFFEKQYGAVEPFNSIENVATIRTLVSLDKMGQNWAAELKGPQDKIEWLRRRLIKK